MDVDASLLVRKRNSRYCNYLSPRLLLTQGQRSRLSYFVIQTPNWLQLLQAWEGSKTEAFNVNTSSGASEGVNKQMNNDK